jgi:hypothetical protein
MPGAALATTAGDRIDLELFTAKKVAMVLCVLLTPCTFGITLLIAAWVLYIEPKAVDREGLTPRFGSKLLWRDLTGVTHVRIMRASSPVGFRIEFKFSTGSAQINSLSTAQATQAIKLVESATGRKIISA